MQLTAGQGKTAEIEGNDGIKENTTRCNSWRVLRGGGSAGESLSGEIPSIVIVGGGGNACRGDRCRAERAVPRTVDADRLWRRGVHDAFLGNLYLEGEPGE